MSLFDRDVELIIQREGESFSIRNLMIDFRVQKFSNALVDNRATIRVFNLRAEIRDLINRRRLDIKEKPYTSIFLSAGYKGETDSTALIFRGVVINGANSRIGPDWISDFDCYTAKAQKESAVCDPGKHTWLQTPAQNIIDTLFADFNTNAPRFTPGALSALAGQNLTIACSGRIDQNISKILAKFGLIYTIEDDGPFVIESAGASNPDDPDNQIPLVSAETGLIGTPKITHNGVEIRSLLNPKLKIFQRFLLRSLTTDGSLVERDQQFSIVKLEHFGSNRGDDFFTEASGKFFPRINFEASPVEPAAAFTTNPVVVGGP